MSELPKKYKHTEIEEKWRNTWEEKHTYKSSIGNRENTYVVDTPPPTVSGALHIGHVYSYTQTDVQVRYQRMRGKNIFYPMGWDDNGLPTERRVQNVFGIQCDPKLSYESKFKAEKISKKNKEIKKVSRKNFIELCQLVTAEDETVFEKLWKKLGLSVDWSLTYTTIGKHAQKISQLSFIDLVEKGFAFNTESITMWDVDFKTAVAQAEVEDKIIKGAYHDLNFSLESGEKFIISTTRPELLPACIAVAAHPDDDRYKKYFGKNAITPLFHAPVPIVASEHADPEKGSGILMICTFGDIADVDWWKQSGLPIKQVIGLDGKLMDIKFGEGPFVSNNKTEAQKNYDEIKGLYVKKAKAKIVDLLQASGDMVGEPKPMEHPVRFYEKGDRPLEFIPTRQWFLKVLDYKKELLELGSQITWHPEYMKTRYDHWVEGLNQEWCISRQRFFGVPFPLWFETDKNGQTNYEKPIFASKDNLPVDPLSDVPSGFKEEQRNQPNGFTAETDVMDTWATSSLTPQLMSGWGIDAEKHQTLFPVDLRPQAHDIIRTWAFYTIAKAFMHENKAPWKHATISGFILDPDRKKMSKSKGNAVTPEDILDNNSSDVVRYWAAKGRLGVDSAFDETQFKIGRKLTTKIFNASKFVLMQIREANKDTSYYDLSAITAEFDRSWIENLTNKLTSIQMSFDNYDYTGALNTTEELFWDFCDNYLELVKVVSYQGGESDERRSALASLNYTLKTLLRLFAPFLPFITDEIWSWQYSNDAASVHLAVWPTPDEPASINTPSRENIYTVAKELMGKIRMAKTESKKSLKAPVEKLLLKGSQEAFDSFKFSKAYILAAGNVEETAIVEEPGKAPQDSYFEIQVSIGE